MDTSKPRVGMELKTLASEQSETTGDLGRSATPTDVYVIIKHKNLKSHYKQYVANIQ
jgi:hypothetical protein